MIRKLKSCLNKLSNSKNNNNSNAFMLQVHQAMAAYDQPSRSSRPFSSGNWQGHPSRQMEQLQKQVERLENDLRRYQNPRRPDFRSYGRSFRSTEGDPICTFCHRVGHAWRVCRQRNRDPRLPRSNGQPAYSGQSTNRTPPSQLNARAGKHAPPIWMNGFWNILGYHRILLLLLFHCPIICI